MGNLLFNGCLLAANPPGENSPALLIQTQVRTKPSEITSKRSKSYALGSINSRKINYAADWTTLKPDRSQKLDPKQKRHHPAPICTQKDSGAAGGDQLWKGKKRKKAALYSKLKTNSLSCETPQGCPPHRAVLCPTQSTAVLGSVTRAGAPRGWQGLGTPNQQKMGLPTHCRGQEYLSSHLKHI